MGATRSDSARADARSEGRSRPAGVPVQLTSFVGREQEIAAVVRLLGRSRLVTLVGAGGSGKTRLAAETAQRLVAAGTHGTVWVELAALQEPELLSLHLLNALGLREDAARAPLDVVLDALQGGATLLVLDNCEHLVQGCATAVDAILRGCPAVRVLATSRERLGVGGERPYLVPVLSLPPLGDCGGARRVAASEAAQLFVERAQGVLPSFELTDGNAAAVARICRRLDGLPLAIELAAARVRVIAPEQIADRLADCFRLLTSGGHAVLPRHRTLGVVFDWSYRLLDDREQQLLRRLSVFAGSFSLDVVETICADDVLPSADVLDVLTALVDKSLVTVELSAGEARYRLLEVVRQYAEQLLRETPEAEAIRTRHAEFFLGLAEEAEPHLFGGVTDPAWTRRVNEEMPNFRSAADWFTRDPLHAEAALRLFTAIHWHWFFWGYFEDGVERLTRALAMGEHASALSRGKALTALGLAAFWRGDREHVRGPLEESVAVLRRTTDRAALAYACCGLGAALMLDDEAERARELLEEAVDLARATEPRVLSAYVLYWYACAAQWRGEYGTARRAFEEAVAVGRADGRWPHIAYPLGNLGLLFCIVGDFAAAVGCLSEALGLHQRMLDHWGLVRVLNGLAAVSRAYGAPAQAATLAGAAQAVCDRVGIAVPPDLRAFHPALMTSIRDALPRPDFDAAWERGRAMSLTEAVDWAASLVPALAAHGASRAPAAAATAGAPGAALQVRALGRLEIHRGGEPLPPSAWRSARPRELLLYLLCHPDGCTREQCGLVFWPDAAPAHLKNSFHVSLYHLRRALGDVRWVVVDGDRYRVNRELGVEFDAATFAAGVEAALRAVKRGGDAVEQLQPALALYRGDFLEGTAVGDWHLEHRDRLRRLYVDGMIALGGCLELAERWDEAVDAYARLASREPLHEEACRRLMRCHARRGERAEGMRHYERLALLLRTDLDAEPDPATTAVYERIRRAEPT